MGIKHLSQTMVGGDNYVVNVNNQQLKTLQDLS